jgi:hypothetical protein
MPQLVGQPCVRCGQPIVSLLVGGACPGCGKAVHHACRVPDEELDTPWHCSRCGCDPSALTRAGDEDRLPAAPAEVDGPFRPIHIPDIRRRRSFRQIAVRALVLLVLAGAVVGLCYAGYRWMQLNEIERLVRNGFEQQLNQKVTAINLKRTDTDVYSGTVTTVAGEEWDVTARVTPNQQIRWRVSPPKERAERDLREDMEKKLNKKVRSIELVRQADGRWSGTAELESGEQYDIREPDDDDSHLFVYEWNQATVEKWIRQHARDQFNDLLDTLSVTRQGPTRYTGKAVGKSGLHYTVSIIPLEKPVNGVRQARLVLAPRPDFYPRWASRKMEEQMGVKVKKITLAAQPAGHHSGQAVVDTGEVYEVRAGTPPAWRNSDRDGEVDCQWALSRSSYRTWASNSMEKKLKSKVESIQWKPGRDGVQVGIVHLADGRRYRARLETKKAEKKAGDEPLWPDLPNDEVGWKAQQLP